MVQEVAQITEVAQKFTPTDINKIADVLDHSTLVTKLPVNVGEHMLKAVDKLIAAGDQAVHVANVETKAANRYNAVLFTAHILQDCDNKQLSLKERINYYCSDLSQNQKVYYKRHNQLQFD